MALPTLPRIVCPSVIAGAGLIVPVSFGLPGPQESPPEAQVTRDAPGAPEVVWEFDAGDYRFSEVIAGFGMVFALDRQGKIHGLDGTEGDLLWSTGGKESMSYSFGFAILDRPDLKAVVVACDAGLLALDPKTGGEIWRTEIELGVAGPACAKETIVAASSDGHVYGFRPTTGKILWKHGYMSDAPEDPPGFDGRRARFEGRPARPKGAVTDGKTVAVSIFDQCRTIAVDALTGERLWSFRTLGWVSGPASFGADHVFIPSQDKHLYAVDKVTGELRWKVQTRGRVSRGGTQSGGTVFFGSCDARLYAVDVASGEVAWEFETEHEEGRGAPIYSLPVVQDGQVHLAAMRGKVYSVDAKTGGLLWKFEPVAKSEINSELIAAGDRFFLTTRVDIDGAGESTVIAFSR